MKPIIWISILAAFLALILATGTTGYLAYKHQQENAVLQATIKKLEKEMPEIDFGLRRRRQHRLRPMREHYLYYKGRCYVEKD